MPDWLPATTAVVLSALILLARIGRAENHCVEHFDRQVNHLGRKIMSEVQSAIDGVVAQLVKARGEIVAARDALVAQIVDVQNQLDAAGVPAEQVDLSALTAAAQSLDDIVPDAPEVSDVEPPAEVVGEPVSDDADADVPADS